MNAENYYVENKKGCFAIVKAELIELIKEKADEKGQEVFIRPMHPGTERLYMNKVVESFTTC